MAFVNLPKITEQDLTYTVLNTNQIERLTFYHHKENQEATITIKLINGEPITYRFKNKFKEYNIMMRQLLLITDTVNMPDIQ